jgi:hypothetical protein
MTRDRKARLLTIAALALALGDRRRPQPAFPFVYGAAAYTPQDTIYAMLDASRAGDARA